MFQRILHLYCLLTRLIYFSAFVDELVCRELKLQSNFDWFTVNKISLNVAKTNFILFNDDTLNRNHKFKISIDGNRLKRVENVKFLGIHTDS